MAGSKIEAFFELSALIVSTNKACDEIIENADNLNSQVFILLAGQWEKKGINSQQKYLLMMAMIFSDDLAIKKQCENKLKAILRASLQQESEPNTKVRSTFYNLRANSTLTPVQAMSLAWIYFVRFLHTPRHMFSRSADLLQEFVQAAVYMNRYFEPAFKEGLGQELSQIIEEQYLAARQEVNRLVEKNMQMKDELHSELKKIAPHIYANICNKEYEYMLTCTNWSAAQKT